MSPRSWQRQRSRAFLGLRVVLLLALLLGVSLASVALTTQARPVAAASSPTLLQPQAATEPDYRLKPDAMQSALFAPSAAPIDICTEGGKFFTKWYFGNAALDFDTPSGDPIEITTSAMNNDEGVFSMADVDGNLLFYSNGVNIWNRNNSLMPNSGALGGDTSSAQSGIVVPDPADGNLYYIFTAYGPSYPNRYSTLDMTLDSGLGNIVLKNQELPGGDQGQSEKVTAARHANGTDYWVVTAKHDTADLFVYQVTAAGILTPTVYNLGGTSNSGGGGMDFSTDGNQLFVNAYFSNVVFIIDFDKATGVLSNKRELPAWSPYSAETSPNSKVLYISSLGSGVTQYDLTQPTISAIQSSATLFIKSSPDGSTNLGQIETGPDGRLYVAQAQTYHGQVNWLDVIEYPNILGTGATYRQKAFEFTGGRGSRTGLPNNFPCPVKARVPVLTELTVEGGELTPTFTLTTTVNTTTTTYSTTVPHGVDTLTITAAVTATTGATISVTVTPSGGVPLICTGDPFNCPLVEGSNLISVTVTAQDGGTLAYTIAATRLAPADDANLIDLALSTGTLAPAFISSTLTYTADVTNVASVNITPTLSHPYATAVVTVTPPSGPPVTCTGNPPDCPLAVGANVIVVTVLAEDGIATKSYTTTVTRYISNDATLIDLELSEGELSPTFDSGTTSYTATVNYAYPSVAVTPTLSGVAATYVVTVTPSGGSPVVCTGDPLDCPLEVGENTIEVTVTAEDGSTVQTYTVVVTRQPAATDATLSDLELSEGTLSPTFASGTVSYTASVTNVISSVAITPTVSEPYATFVVTVTKAGGDVVTCTGDPLDCPLEVGANVIVVTVTAQDGSTIETYTVTVTRAPSDDATLSDLAIYPGTLSPAFDSGTSSYTAVVTNVVTSVAITPTVNEPNATAVVTVTLAGGGEVACTGDPLDCPLEVGANIIVVTVTAEDGTVQSYTVTVTREPSDDATLSALAVYPAELSPVFDSGTISYTATVTNVVTSMAITPTVNEPNATAVVTVTLAGGSSVTCTGNPLDCPLEVGENVIVVTVTAEDGTTIATYTVTVTREPSDDATLSTLAIYPGTLSPVFDSGTLGYTATVTNVVTSIAITPTVNEPNATAVVTVTLAGGSSVACTGNPLDCPLEVGENVIVVTVTAEDGTTIATYTITLTREPSADATLSALAVYPAELSPVFDSGTLGYTATVTNVVTSVAITPTVNEPNASAVVTVTLAGGSVVACTGNPLDCPLEVGENVIVVTVTAEDGTTSETYTITITREPSDDATLRDLAIYPGTLSPAFASGTISYTATVTNVVTSVAITPTVNEPNATTVVTVTLAGGNVVTCTGDPLDCPLEVGENVIAVTVTAEDGTVTQYTVTVTRERSSDASLIDLAISHGTLSPEFDSAIREYLATVSSIVNNLGVTPTVSEANATTLVTVTPPGGTPMTCTGAPLICPLVIGENVIAVTVTAQDGSTRTYTAVVTRLSDDATLVELRLDGATLAPPFDSQITNYATNVDNGMSSVNVIPTVNESHATTAIRVTPPGGTPLACPGTPAACPLAVGNNVIEVIVTAQDGSTQTYTTTVTRAPSSNALLSALAVSNGSLAPSFAPNTTAYVGQVAANLTEVTITPTTADPTATVTVNGVAVASGSPSAAFALPTGSHLVVDVVVTAESGATQSYQVVVNRPPSVVNTALSTLQNQPIAGTIASKVADADGDSWTAALAVAPAQGTVVLNPDGSFTYTPVSDFVGLDTFTVTVVDANGATTEILVSIPVIALAKSEQAGDVLLQDNQAGSTHTLTNALKGTTPLFTMELQLPPNTYTGVLNERDIFYLLYTEILTPTAEVMTPPNSLQFAGNIFTLEAFLNDLNLENFVFGEPIRLTLQYDEALLEEIEEASLVLYYWDTDTQSWEQSGLTEVGRDLEANTVTYLVAHLTQFSWFGTTPPYHWWFPFMAR
ncbi:MAG: cadherin-like beta sandwich domain-containing protein [Caldilineaceae bacterium]|nr:cadherin-like beta sandwich domain-containing protein [Caldilineaceae bacterium]